MSQVLNVRQAATLLGVHPNSLRNYAKAGTVPAAKIGRGWRFLEADLVAWLRERYSGSARMQLSADHEEATTWHSGNVQVSTISTSQPRTEHELDALLERPTGKRRENTTTG